MDNKEYVKELNRIVMGETKSRHIFRSENGEKFMEHAISSMVACMLEIKQEKQSIVRDPTENKIIHHLAQLKELLAQECRLPRKELHLHSRVLKLFMEGDAMEASAIQKEVVENAEEWIHTVKRVYQSSNVNISSFKEGRAFWGEFNSRILSIQNFYHSEEYKFLIECLDSVGEVVLRYTLDSLFTLQKIYRLSHLFLKYYSDIDCEYIGKYSKSVRAARGMSELSCFIQLHGLEQMLVPSEGCVLTFSGTDLSSGDSAFVASCEELLDKLKGAPVKLRIIRKSITRLINRLRLEILANICKTPTEYHHGLLLKYNNLVDDLAGQKEETSSQQSAVTGEELEDLKGYHWIVRQISDAMKLYRTVGNGISPSCRKQLVDAIVPYHNKFRMMFFSDLNTTLEHTGQPIPLPGCSEDELTGVAETDIFKSIVEMRASAFNKQNITSTLHNIIAKILSYKEFYCYEQFLRSTKTNRIAYLSRMTEITQDKMDVKSTEDVVVLADVLASIDPILQYYETSILLDALISLQATGKMAIETYLSAFAGDLEEMVILVVLGQDGKPVHEAELARMEGISVGCFRLTDLDVVLRETFLLKRINGEFLKKDLIRLSAGAYQIEEEYHKIRSIVSTYKHITAEDPGLFRSSAVEEYLLRLADLKWKYYQEHSRTDYILNICLKMERDYFLFHRQLSRLLRSAASDLTFTFSPEKCLEFFDLKIFQKEPLLEVIQKKMPELVSIFKNAFISRLVDECPFGRVDVFVRFFHSRAVESKRIECKRSEMPPEATRITPEVSSDETAQCEFGFIIEPKQKDKFVALFRPFYERIPSECFRSVLDIESALENEWSRLEELVFSYQPSEVLMEDSCGMFFEYTKYGKLVDTAYALLRHDNPLFRISVDELSETFITEKTRAFEETVTFIEHSLKETAEYCASVELDSPDQPDGLPDGEYNDDQEGCYDQLERHLISQKCEKQLRVIGDILGYLHSVCARTPQDDFAGYCLYERQADERVAKLTENMASIAVERDDAPDINGDRVREAIEKRREYLNAESVKIEEAYNSLRLDGADFASEETALRKYNQCLTRRIRRFNVVLAAYDSQPMEYPQISNLEVERAVFSDAKMVVEEMQSTRLRDIVAACQGILSRLIRNKAYPEHFSHDTFTFPPSRLLTSLIDFLDSFRSKMALELREKLISYEKLFGYIEELLTYHDFFDLEITVGEYLLDSACSEIAEAIKKSRSSRTISEYLNSATVLWSYTEIERIRGIEVVANLKRLRNTLATAWDDFELITKFNKYNMYGPELLERERMLGRDDDILAIAEEIQQVLLEYSDLMNMDIFSVEKAECLCIATKYSKFLSMLHNSETVHQFPYGEQAMALLDRIRKACVEVRRKLKEKFREYREENYRLYFVSDEKLMRAVNRQEELLNVLCEVFNITGVLTAENEITGMETVQNHVSAEHVIEQIVFAGPISLSQPIAAVVTAFEDSMKNELRAYFDAKFGNVQGAVSNHSTETTVQQSSRIEMVEELFQEFCYFNSAHKPGASENYKLKTLLRLSGEHPDILSLYPAPRLINGHLHMGSIPYSFEYYPPAPFVFTSLTAHIFCSIMLNFHLPGLLIYGPSGIGKTETIKYFCRTVGAPLYTFCCSENLKFSSLENIIVGCARLGSYICFDEFNRLSEEVMSSVTECIYQYRERIKIFLTMNLGYQGRHVLPRSLKAIFGEVRADRPDLQAIVSYYTGNESLFNLLTELKARCTNQPHYDFGLRSISSVLGRHVQSLNDKILSDSEVLGNVVPYFMASLLSEDRRAFVGLVRKYYGIEIAEPEYTIQRLFQDGLCKSNGIMICGSQGMELLLGHDNAHVYNPLNLLLTNQSIFGTFDSNREWRDSVFLRDLRENAMSDTWFVFDGPVLSEWIEDFNSVLDDNRILCLVTGERIKIRAGHKFIFLCNSMENVTPATLTRVFLLFTDENPVRRPVEHGTVSVDDLQLLSDHLGHSKTAILVGRCGAGKKEIARRCCSQKFLEMDAGEFDMEAFREFSHGVVYFDGFESASQSLVEIVREFSTRGRVGELSLRGVRMICGVDMDETQIGNFIASSGNRPGHLYDPLYGLMADTGIFRIIEQPLHYLAGAFGSFMSPVLTNLLGFIKSHLCAPMNDIRKLLKLLNAQAEFLGVHMAPSTVYFAVRVVFGDDETIKSYMEILYDESISDDWLFDPYNCTFGCVDIDVTKSKLAFLIHCRVPSVIIRGPRLCGKKWLLKEALDILGPVDIEIVHWSGSRWSHRSPSPKIHDAPGTSAAPSSRPIVCYLTVERCRKRIAENSIELLIAGGAEHGPEYTMDPVEYLKSLENDRTNSHDSLFISVDQCYTHPDCCEHQTVEFTNLYKYNDYRRIVKLLHGRYKKETEERQRFLKAGIERIEEFKTEADTLRGEIGKKNKCLRIKVEEIDRLVKNLETERVKMAYEHAIVDRTKKQLEVEMEKSSQKKLVVAEKLELVEPLLFSSKQALNEITKAQLSEIKAMSSPPPTIKSIIEFVYYVLEGRHKSDWKELLGYMKSEDFMSKVMNYLDDSRENGRIMSDDRTVLSFFQNITHDKARKASVACEALYTWAKACVEYSRVLKETHPLQLEIEALTESIAVQSVDLNREQKRLAELTETLTEHETRQNQLVSEMAVIQEELLQMDQKKQLLDQVLERLLSETENWKRIEYKCPIRAVPGYILDIEHSGRILFALASDNISDILDSSKFVTISLEEQSCKKAIHNAILYDTPVFITDANCFNSEVYQLIKQRIESFSLQGGEAISHQPVVLEGALHNCYAEETYEYQRRVDFGGAGPTRLKEEEEQLLLLLDSGSDLQAIIHQKDLLDQERERVEHGKAMVEYSKRVAKHFARLTAKFKNVYTVGTSLTVFKEFLQTSNNSSLGRLSADGPSSIAEAEEYRIIREFYAHSFFDAEASSFDMEEASLYSFDYLFISLLDDIIFGLKKAYEFDLEISAGAPENNARIIGLLSEASNKLILVKNAHFLPSVLNLGTNRFFFVMERGAQHPLIGTCRVVCCDRNLDRKQLYDSLSRMFNSSDDIVRFHALLLSLGLEFSLRDLETALKHDECDRQFIMETIYLSRLEEDKASEVMGAFATIHDW